MYIKNIEWLDQNEKEAIAVVSDSKYEITCFADRLQQGINLHIQPELIPGDIDDDEQMEFDCSRIDIWEAI